MHLKQSENEYDWLGHGIYFWEHSPERARQFAQEKFKWEGRRARIAVIGAVIDPRLCLNLLEASALGFVKEGYEALLLDRGGREYLPKNGDGSKNWQRNLDCAVINMVHQIRKLTQQAQWQKQNPSKASLQSYDSVRGAFWEGGPLYEGARIEKKSHIQICVRNIDCIKGYFRPVEI